MGACCSCSHSSAKDRVVLITGASSGIGEELAYQYARQGAKLVLGARRTERLESVRERCLTEGAADVAVLRTDVSVQSDCKQFIEDSVARFGAVHFLILNAGVSMGTFFEDIPENELPNFRTMMDVNFFGCVWTTYYALPHLKAVAARGEPAHIGVVSSLAGINGIPTRSTYGATKRALHGFYDSLRTEFLARGHNISITLACPGPVATEINEHRLGSTVIGLDANRSMPAECAAQIVINAVASRKRIDTFTTLGWLGTWVSFFWPALADRIAVRMLNRYSMAEPIINNKAE